MTIQGLYTLIQDDMQSVDAVIQRQLRSDIALINQIGYYIVNSGGKRLRPALLLLSAGALNYNGRQHWELAAVIEFIHTATLLHDDVVDASQLRRGEETANARWGSEASVLVGDFLYSRSFQMMVQIGSMRVMEILAEVTNTIAEGEVLQLLNCHDADTTEERYLEVIHRKTAKLFEAAGQLGAVLAGATPAQEQDLAAYGRHLGAAFQLVDDVLDYSASPEEMGKNIGDDLAEGKPTLPLIYAMRHGTPEQAEVIRRAIEQGGREAIADVTHAVESTGAIAYTARCAQDQANQAIACLDDLPASRYKDALRGLAEFAVNRTY
ncbi:octaprenyl diphosphate synthase [Ectothiorhodospiraceae bacterium 2226]|nr:octaprenyl diphosphate synthase [Ectothiorhodospiraceae bacterium 2226]